MVAVEAMMAVTVTDMLDALEDGLRVGGTYYHHKGLKYRLEDTTRRDLVTVVHGLRKRYEDLVSENDRLLEMPVPPEPTEAEQTVAFLQAEELTTLRERVRSLEQEVADARRSAEVATESADGLSSAVCQLATVLAKLS